MHRVLEYSILFVVMLLLQIFIFSRIGFSIYLTPLVYISFILLLPMEIKGATLLFLSMAMGVAVDLFTGSAGLHTIASLFTAFCRPTVLLLVVGKDEIKQGGGVNANRLDRKRFLKYASIMIFLHCIVFFTFESLSWHYFHLILLRTLVSGVVTLILVYFSQRLFMTGNYERPQAGGMI